jgi:hypothetical protein
VLRIVHCAAYLVTDFLVRLYDFAAYGTWLPDALTRIVAGTDGAGRRDRSPTRARRPAKEHRV